MPELLQQWYEACRASQAYQEAVNVLKRTLEKKVNLKLKGNRQLALNEEWDNRDKMLRRSLLGNVWATYGDSDTLEQYIGKHDDIDDFERQHFFVQRLLLEHIEQLLTQAAESSPLQQIVQTETPDPETVERENALLAQTNTIFGQGVNLYALKRFIQTRFLINLEQKNQWTVLWLFCMDHNMLKLDCRQEDQFVEQIVQAEWFGDIAPKLRPSVDALANYSWLKHPPVERWNDPETYNRFFKKGRNSFDAVCQMQALYMKLERAYTAG